MSSRELRALQEIPAANRGFVLCQECSGWFERNDCDHMHVYVDWLNTRSQSYFSPPTRVETVKLCVMHKLNLWIHDFQGRLEAAREAAFAAGILQHEPEFDAFILHYLDDWE